MSQTNNGGYAFPYQIQFRKDVAIEFIEKHPGMTLRDWFAGQALCGWAAGRNCDGFCETSAHDVVATACYKYADAMLKARDAK